MLKHTRTKIIPFSLALFLIFILTGIAPAATKKNYPEDGATMTEAELQSQVMAFADRYVSIISAGVNAYQAQDPPPENYRSVLSVAVYSMSSAFTIAAESNPAGSLLDMIAMVTLGRIIFEENWQKKLGPQLQPVIASYRKAEEDIWQVSTIILTSAQRKELSALIYKWRQDHPEIVFFPTIRFSNFSALRSSSDSDGKKSSGLFKSVENATQQVEDARLLAERGMYLATRLPLLTGLFGSVWFSQLVRHPDIEKIVNDVHTFSQLSEQLTAVVERLPDQIAAERDTTIKQAMENITTLTMSTIDETAKKVSLERKAAIKQLMNEFSAERKQTIEDFLNEDQRVRGLLEELRQTLLVGNDILLSVNTLTQTLDLGPKETQSDATAKPFEIKDYQATLKEASITIRQLHEMLKTVNQMGLEKALPQIVSVVETVEERGEKWVFFAFFLGVALILIFLVGAVIASLVYRHFANRIFRSIPQQA